jgi:hypothetical protein
MPIALFMAFDEIVPCTCSLLERIARQRKTWANKKNKIEMYGSYIDLGSISDPFRVRCHPNLVRPTYWKINLISDMRKKYPQQKTTTGFEYK